MITNLTDNKIIQPVYSPNNIKVLSNKTFEVNHKFVWDIYVSTNLGLAYTKVSRLKSVNTNISQVEIHDIIKNYVDENDIPNEFNKPLLKVQVKVGEEYGATPVLYNGNDVVGSPSVIVSTYQVSYSTLNNYFSSSNGLVYNNLKPFMSVLGDESGVSYAHNTFQPLTNRPLNIDLYRVKSDKKALRNYAGSNLTLNDIPEYETKIYEPIYLSHYIGKVRIDYPQKINGSILDFNVYYNNPKRLELKYYDIFGGYINERVIELDNHNFNDKDFNIQSVNIQPRLDLSPDLIGFNILNGTIGDVLDENLFGGNGPGSYVWSVEKSNEVKCGITPPDVLVLSATYSNNNNWNYFNLDKEYVDLGSVGKPVETVQPTPTPTPVPVYSFNITQGADPCNSGGDEYVLYGLSPVFLDNDNLYTDFGLNNLWVETNSTFLLVNNENVVYEYDGENFIGSTNCVPSSTPTATPTPTPTATPTATPTPVPTATAPPVTGFTLSSINVDVTGEVYATRQLSNGNIVIGGLFTAVNGSTRNNIAMINSSGVLQSFNPNFNNFINYIEELSNGNLLVVGFFTAVNGSTRNYAAVINTSGTLQSFSVNFNSSILVAKELSNGDYMFGGSFSMVNGNLQEGICITSPTGVVRSFDPGLNNSVFTAKQLSNGNILMGGAFTSVSGTSRPNVAIVDLSGNLQAYNPSVNIQIYTSKEFPNGDILIAGSDTPGGESAYITNSTGTVLTPSFRVDSIIRATEIVTGGNILMGGMFTEVEVPSSLTKGIIELDQSFNLQSFNLDTNGNVFTIEELSNGDVIIGGDFTTIDGITRNGMAIITLT